MNFDASMLLDNEGGSGERRIARIARSPIGHQEIMAKIEHIFNLWKKHGSEAWESEDKLIFPVTQLGELTLTLLERYKLCQKD